MPSCECVRADEERVGGIISRADAGTALLCDVAVADLTTANANVYYELGVRHAVRPFTTVLVFADGVPLPFDFPARGAVSRTTSTTAAALAPEEDRRALTERLVETIQQPRPIGDSPIFPLLDMMAPPHISRLRTDVFRDEVEYSADRKEELRRARATGPDAVRAVLHDLGDLRHAEVGVVVDLLLSFRAVEAHADMVELVERHMGPTMQGVTLVREQYAFALNRAGRGDDAEHVLLELIRERGPSSETYGLLGRVYKDRWEIAAAREGNRAQARGLLRTAIDAYTRGFETDWRDAYPGINAVELMELLDPPDPRRHELLPVVRYAAERRLAGTPDYWDHATVLEVAVLQRDEDRARRALVQALVAMREPWEATSTLVSLRRLRVAAEGRGPVDPWVLDVERELAEAVPPG